MIVSRFIQTIISHFSFPVEIQPIDHTLYKYVNVFQYFKKFNLF